MIVSLDTAEYYLRMYWYFIRNGISCPPYPFVAHTNGRFSTTHPQFETLLHDRDTHIMCLQLGYANAPETISPITLEYKLVRSTPDKIHYNAINNSSLLPSITTIGVYELFSSVSPTDQYPPVAWFMGNNTGLTHFLEPINANELRLTLALYKAFDGETVTGKNIMHKTTMEHWRSAVL
ncbi:MAG TPA: hypothetical protein VL995_12350 [Cellvibrio sp.]|nr:hypothetical protein [Cellvibrio sp.]